MVILTMIVNCKNHQCRYGGKGLLCTVGNQSTMRLFFSVTNIET